MEEFSYCSRSSYERFYQVVWEQKKFLTALCQEKESCCAEDPKDQSSLGKKNLATACLEKLAN